MIDLALVVELHHPLPGPGETAGRDWARASVATYWPLLRAIAELGERHVEHGLTLAVSPTWTALAADPVARAATAAELERQAAASEAGRDLARFVAGRCGIDAISILRQTQDRGVIELIPTTASHTWLPRAAQEPILAQAQIRLAADDHRRRFGQAPPGIWLPYLAYFPGLETTMADAGLRYFGVRADAFLRGTILPPNQLLTPLITSAGVAAFGVNPHVTVHLADPLQRYAQDTRYRDPGQAASLPAEQAAHFVTLWRETASRTIRNPDDGAISMAMVTSDDLAGEWLSGPTWLGEVVRRMVEDSDVRQITPNRYLDRHPESLYGQPGPCASSPFAATEDVWGLLEACRTASETLANFVAHRASLCALGRRVLAQMTRDLLLAQSLDGFATSPFIDKTTAALDRGERHLAQFHELAGTLASGRLDPIAIARYELGPAYLPEIDFDVIIK